MLDKLKAIWEFNLFPAGSAIQFTVGQVVLVLVAMTAAWLAFKYLRRFVSRRLVKSDIQPDAVVVVEKVLFWTSIVAVLLIGLTLLNIPLGAFAFISGAVAIGVGFGAQNIINNFLSGWILMTERPVKINDFVDLDGSLGTVEAIGNRSTRIRRVDGVHMLVPNSQLLERVVVNWTLVDRQIRSLVRVGVAYGSPVKRVKELIEQAVTEQPDVLDDPEPRVLFEDFGDSALIFDAFFWANVSGERDLRMIRSDVRFRITELFEAEGIVIAFPQRDVHLDVSSPLAIRLLADKDDTGAAP